MLRTRPRTRVRLRPALLAPAVVAIVLGVLGMHGVDAHGVNMHRTMTHTEAATPAASAMPGHNSVASQRTDAYAPASTVPTADDRARDDADGMSGMVMLCGR